MAGPPRPEGADFAANGAAQHSPGAGKPAARHQAVVVVHEARHRQSPLPKLLGTQAMEVAIATRPHPHLGIERPVLSGVVARQPRKRPLKDQLRPAKPQRLLTRVQPIADAVDVKRSATELVNRSFGRVADEVDGLSLDELTKTGRRVGEAALAYLRGINPDESNRQQPAIGQARLDRVAIDNAAHGRGRHLLAVRGTCSNRPQDAPKEKGERHRAPTRHLPTLTKRRTAATTGALSTFEDGLLRSPAASMASWRSMKIRTR